MSTPLLARIVGSIQWVCPNCSWIHGTKKLNWRRPRLVCRRCAARWIVGIVAIRQILTPLEAYRSIASWRSGPLNVVAPDHDLNVVKAIARFTGLIELRCPSCLQTSRSEIWPDMGEAVCGHCGTSWYIAPLFHRLDVRSSHYAPSDWTPHVQPIQTDQDRPAAQAVGEVQ